MEKSVSRIVVSIIITLILVVISIPLWNYSSGKKGALLVDSYEDLSIAVTIGEFKELLIVEDNRALDLIDTTKLSLRNRNDFSKDCELLMLVNKDSTIDYSYVRVAVEDKIFKLKDLDMYEDNDNYYFVIGNYDIDAYSNIEVNVRIWLGEDIGVVLDKDSLITNFITK